MPSEYLTTMPSINNCLDTLLLIITLPHLDYHYIGYSDNAGSINLLVNCRMPKCNTVLQSEDDLFEPEIQPNSHGNC